MKDIEIHPKNFQKGQIQLILGPMFSGKSTELIRRLKRYQVAKYDVLIVKYAKDVRYDEYGISTHDRQTLPAVAATTLTDLTDMAKKYDVIGIDEGQFFPDVAWAEDMANNGKVVLIAALDGTYQRKPFQNIMNLVPLAENVSKLNAVCMNCFGEAAYTKRTSNEESLEVIGGADKYMAACRTCYRLPSVVEATSPREREKAVAAEDLGVSPPKKTLFAQAVSNLGSNAA
jgi:thymidine kinase